ncbi:MAG: ABC transporter ATP-binding protein [Anaerolineae bacterium]|nr:ABC transporter ATP-binding protein [Anaerolineae bacterium]
MSTDLVLQTEHLKKHFGKVRAVEEVSLQVRRGEVFGFLGPNGSGKTTTIGMVLGLLHPTGGRVELFGQEVTPGRNRALQRVGALVGSPALVPYLSARENLQLIARLHPDVSRQRIDQVLAIVGLSEAADRRAEGFSTGMKQRLGLAMALLHQPELLVLDEPTNGMDPAGMREIRTLLRSLAEQGVTVFLSSHLLHEVEQVCDRVAVLNKGRVVALGSVGELLGKQQEVVRVRVSSPSEAARRLQSLPGATSIKPNGAYVEVAGVSGQVVVLHLTSGGIVPSEVSTSRPDLESLFLELTQETA